MKKILVTILTLQCSLLFAGKISMSEGLKTAFNKVIELKITEAEKLINQEEASNPNNLALPYLKGFTLSVKMFVEDDKSWFEENLEELEDYIDQLDEAPDSDPQKRLMISELRLLLAIQHTKYQNMINGGVQFYKAYNSLVENYEKFPNYYPTYVPLGVLNVAVGSLPDGYQSIASVIGIQGGVEKGLRLIKKGYWNCISDKKWRFYRDYFGAIYSFTSFSIAGSHDISPKSLSIDYQKSSYLIYIQSMIEVGTGDSRNALNLLTSRPQGEEYYPYHYLDHYTGKLALSFSPDTAQVYFAKYLRNRKTDNYLKSTYRYLSWAAMLKGENEQVLNFRKKVLSEGTLNTGADKQAYREAKVPMNEVLIRGRIWFDGGLYSKAAEYLKERSENVRNFSMEDKVEYHYRLGRIYQEMDQRESAIGNFRKALEVNLEKATFALGNSSLQLALTLEKNGDKKAALKYFKSTLIYKDYPFYEGVHQQAKSGIDRVK